MWIGLLVNPIHYYLDASVKKHPNNTINITKCKEEYNYVDCDPNGSQSTPTCFIFIQQVGYQLINK